MWGGRNHQDVNKNNTSRARTTLNELKQYGVNEIAKFRKDNRLIRARLTLSELKQCRMNEIARI